MLSLLSLLADSPFTSDDFLKKLIPNFWSFLIQLLALVVLIVAVVYLGYKPMKRLIQKRRAYTEQNLKGSEDALKKAEAMKKAASDNLSASRSEANAIVSKAREEATRQKEAVLLEAKQETKKMQEEAQAAIAQETEKAKKELRDHVADLAVLGAEKLLEEKSDSKKDKAIVEDFLNELEEDDG